MPRRSKLPVPNWHGWGAIGAWLKQFLPVGRNASGGRQLAKQDAESQGKRSIPFAPLEGESEPRWLKARNCIAISVTNGRSHSAAPFHGFGNAKPLERQEGGLVFFHLCALSIFRSESCLCIFALPFSAFVPNACRPVGENCCTVVRLEHTCALSASFVPKVACRAVGENRFAILHLMQTQDPDAIPWGHMCTTHRVLRGDL
jgi:hypothetical protein